MEDLETVEFGDTLGAIADQNLTRCSPVCFTGTEEDRAEQHDQGTIDEVLEDQDKREEGDTLEEANREADLLKQIPSPGHPESEKERLASRLRLSCRTHVAIRRQHRNLDICQKEHSCRCHVLPELHKITSTQPRLFDARDAFTRSRCLKHTQGVTTSFLQVQSRSGGRCVRDRRLSWHSILNPECCLYGNYVPSSKDCERV